MTEGLTDATNTAEWPTPEELDVINLYAHLFALYTVTKERVTNEDRGATAVEYGLLVGLIAVAIIVAVVALGGQLTTLFNSITTELGGTAPTTTP